MNYIAAAHKSLKSVAIVAAKNEADNRVDSTVCVTRKQGDNIVYLKNTGRPEVRCIKIYCDTDDKRYKTNEKH